MTRALTVGVSNAIYARGIALTILDWKREDGWSILSRRVAQLIADIDLGQICWVRHGAEGLG